MSTPLSIGDHLIEALTQQEIICLLDALWATLPPDRQDEVLDQLPPDTRQTVQHILSPPDSAGAADVASDKPVSTAKLEQTWATLWQDWNSVVAEAAEEDGDYMTQDEHWEPPYFDQHAFVNDLEEVAKKMRPLVQNAVQNHFSPNLGFAEALSLAEDEISTGMPEWIEIHDGFYLEDNLTYCLFKWEWLKFKELEEDAFAFAEHILDLEDGFTHVTLDDNTFLDFFTQLPEADQEIIFKGLTSYRDTPPWKKWLDNTYSPWHTLYMYWVEQYSPERYLDNLRTTIPQQWQNGLPVIEDLLAKQNYRESLKVIKETLPPMLKREQGDPSWTPETALLFATINHYSDDADELKIHRQLLDYYRQTAKGLGQTELVNILTVQLIAIDHFYDWETMFDTLGKGTVPPQTRQALFESWRDYIVKRAKPHTWGSFGWRTQARNTWWLHWLIESIVDGQKGTAWFQQEMARWLTNLPENQTALGEDFDLLRLLTKDLTEIGHQDESEYPKFYQVVVRPRELSSPDQSSRQAYLKQYASDDLMYQVMGYWKAYLQNFVPNPKNADKSDYTQHAHWMAALRELAPQNYEALLANWRVDHHRRRNLWKAMSELELD
jgi:hypothetical protein